MDVLQEVEQVAAAVGALEQDLKVDTIEAFVTSKLRAFDADATRDSIYVADKAARDRYEDGLRKNIDQGLRDRAVAMEREVEALRNGLGLVLEVVKQAPKEQDGQLGATREVAALLRYQGRRLSDLAELYARTSDAENPTLVALIENDRGAFRLTPDTDRVENDLEADRRLRQAIATRQAKRVPPEYVEAHTRASRLMTGLTMVETVNHLKANRGIASRPRPTLVSNLGQ